MLGNNNGIRIHSNSAHLICLGNSRLSTEVSLFEVPIGNITIGSHSSCDIVLTGVGIQDFHCRCSRIVSENDQDLGDVFLSPIGKAKVYVDGLLVNDECLLVQGCMITLGESIYLRFNFPAKAALLKHNAMGSNEKLINNNNYDGLKKNLNTNCVNFTEYSTTSDKSLNNNVKITDKMKSMKAKANDSFPKISNLQVYPSSSKSIENCANVSSGGSIDEMQQLEDVLKMFVEYNNNNSPSKNNLQTSSDKLNVTQQNRIKTNGSLPKNFHTKDHGHSFEFYDAADSKATDDIEIYKKPQSPRTRIKTFVSSPTSSSSKNSLSPTDNNDKSYEYEKNGGFESARNEKDYEKLIKSFEEKFRMDIFNIQNCENITNNDVRSDADNHSNSSNLNSEKNEILVKIRELKILISDIQYQESETFLESDVEKSLVLAEMSNEKSNLSLLNEKLACIKGKMKTLEIERKKRQKQLEIQQIKLKNTIKDKETEIKMLQEQKGVVADSETRLEELKNSLEIDIKSYEDLEFHYLEEETDWASLLEEYKENINTFTKQIEDKKNYIQQLEQTKRVTENSTENEQKTLEKKLFNLKQKLENEREKLKNIDKMLSTQNSQENHSCETDPIPIISNSSAFYDNVSHKNSADLMSKSFNENMFYNRNKIEVSYFDFVEDVSRNSVQMPGTSSTHDISTASSQKNESSNLNNDNASPLSMPKYHSLSSINYSNSNPQMLQKSNLIVTDNGTLKPVVHRQTEKQKRRPLTRYLPNFSLDLNLRHHIETAGHQIQLCPHVIIDATSCRGYLNKVGSNPLFSNLRANTRWFVFDREKQMLVYYSDKSEKKPRGGAYFNAITDVYFDHSTGLKRAFIVKTNNRTFTLQAPSSQACSIWIDVIITGSQGKIFEYEK